MKSVILAVVSLQMVDLEGRIIRGPQGFQARGL